MNSDSCCFVLSVKVLGALDEWIDWLKCLKIFWSGSLVKSSLCIQLFSIHSSDDSKKRALTALKVCLIDESIF